MQGLVLAHLWSAPDLRLRAGYGDRNIMQRRLDAIGPGVAVARRRDFQHLARRPPPAFARQVAQVLRRRSVQHAHHLVPGRWNHAGRLAPARIAREMLFGVPAIGRDVAAAAEGDLIVDHHHLLMMAGAQNARPVQPELHDPAAEPSLGLVRIEALRRRDQQGRAPDQQAHVQIRLMPHQSLQLMTDLRPAVSQRPLRVKPGAGIELPAQNQDRPLRLVQGRGQGVEIGLVLHQRRETMGRRRPPHARTRLDQTGFIRTIWPHNPPMADSRDGLMRGLYSRGRAVADRSIFVTAWSMATLLHFATLSPEP